MSGINRTAACHFFSAGKSCDLALLKYILGVLFFLFLYLPTLSSVSAQELAAKETGLPDFQLTELDGELIRNGDLTGKVVIIDFWATWCGPCLKSFPAMIEVQDRFSENKDVTFLYVNTLEFPGREADYIREFLIKKGFDIPVYLDRVTPNAASLSEKLGITTLPSKFILDKSGEIRYQDSGFSGNHQELVEELTGIIHGLLKL